MTTSGAKPEIILVPDSFKGTLSASEVCSIMESSIHKMRPGVCVQSIPAADGGEGTVESLIRAVGGRIETREVTGPLFGRITARYAILSNGVAVIEMASAAGLPLMGEKLDVMHATTYGVGELIRHVINSGHKEIIVGLGGSATNDGGAGVCAALGVVFRNVKGEAFVPVGASLKKIHSIDRSALPDSLKNIRLRLMCDIDNPLIGPNGAAHVFAKQKGACEAERELLDQGLRHFSNCIRESVGIDVAQLPGAGAAGGMGGGLHALLGGELEKGIDILLDTVGFDHLLEDARLVITGEGKLDSQSLMGKVIGGVAKRTKRAGVPLIALVGDVGDDIAAVYAAGVSAVLSINRMAIPYQEAKKRAKEDLALTLEELFRIMAIGDVVPRVCPDVMPTL